MGYTLVKLVSVSIRIISKPIIGRIKAAHQRNLDRVNSPLLNSFFEKLGNFSHKLDLKMNSKIFSVEDMEMFQTKLKKGKFNI